MIGITRAKTGTGTSTVFVPDYHLAPYNIGIQAVVSGTATYTIEQTLDAEDSTQTTWTAVPSLSALSATALVQSVIPCRGYRINIASGTGTVTATFVQAGRR